MHALGGWAVCLQKIASPQSQILETDSEHSSSQNNHFILLQVAICDADAAVLRAKPTGLSLGPVPHACQVGVPDKRIQQSVHQQV
jgi:hypothetical protein